MDYATIHLEHDTPTPLYQQIADQISQAAHQGVIKPGEQLPPIRRLADLLSVSPITVTQAYRALARVGVVGGQIGRGTFIQPSPPLTATGSGARTFQPSGAFPRQDAPFPPPEETGEAWALSMTRRGRLPRSVALGQVFRRLLRGTSGPSLIDFSGGNPEPALFALANFQQLMEQAGRSLDEESQNPEASAIFQYGSSLGDAALRTFLAGYLPRFGVQTTADTILLTSGTQQGLDLIARTLVEPGDSIFVEQYSYIAALDIFEQAGAQLRPLPLDEDGLQVEAFEHLLGAPQSRPRWLYTIPTGQSPTGISLAVERRRRLVEVAQRYNVLIIEDDAFNELIYEPGPPAPAIRSFAPEARVLYLKSFSKTTFPALRLGCLVADPAVLSILAEQKGLVERGTSLVVARTVLAYLRSVAYERYLEQMRTVYRQRRDVLLAALSRELGPLGCHWTFPRAGFSLLLTLPAELHEMEVLEEAVAQGVAVAPGRFFTPMTHLTRDPTLRLTFADKSPEQLEEATRRLALALRTLLERGRSASPSPHVTTEV
jgi:DNA-binding transcriptional MocR family regulator